MSEAGIQNRIRMALAGRATVFRGNVGQAWTGAQVVRHGRDVYLRDARPLDTGLPKGFSDLFGWVTLDGVARFLALEVKSETGRVTDDQARFLATVRAAGGLSAVVRSPEDALAVIARGSA
ncbi:MAG: hypothetical protein RLZZ127_1555 [Planctomycetota bacterium]|jgi:hypothetical protein